MPIILQMIFLLLLKNSLIIKQSFDLDNLIHYLKSDSDNFYNLIISLMETIGDMDDNHRKY